MVTSDHTLPDMILHDQIRLLHGTARSNMIIHDYLGSNDTIVGQFITHGADLGAILSNSTRYSLANSRLPIWL